MNDLKTMHLLVGVRAEQSLRDAVRTAMDSADDGADDLVLAPAGRKDWIAGVRAGESASFGEITELGRTVLKRLLGLDSRQRIRSENVRIWVVSPPVPVFRDPAALGDEIDEAELDETDEIPSDELDEELGEADGTPVWPGDDNF